MLQKGLSAVTTFAANVYSGATSGEDATQAASDLTHEVKKLGNQEGIVALFIYLNILLLCVFSIVTGYKLYQHHRGRSNKRTYNSLKTFVTPALSALKSVAKNADNKTYENKTYENSKSVRLEFIGKKSPYRKTKSPRRKIKSPRRKTKSPRRTIKSPRK